MYQTSKSVTATCGHCRSSFEVENEDYFGETTCCPNCKSEIYIPYPELIEVKGFSQEKNRKSRIPKNPNLVAELVGFAVIVLAVLLIIFLYSISIPNPENNDSNKQEIYYNLYKLLDTTSMTDDEAAETIGRQYNCSRKELNDIAWEGNLKNWKSPEPTMEDVKRSCIELERSIREAKRREGLK